MLAYQSATRADFPEVSGPATTLFSGCLTRRIVMRQCDSATGTGAFSLNSTRIVLIFLAILAGKVLSGVDGLSHASVWLMRQDATARTYRALRKPPNLAGSIVRLNRHRLAHGKHPPLPS
jgi:hypothetical protein